MTKYIVSCSGGVDSVVLAHYLRSINKLYSVFHFRFKEPEEFSKKANTVVEDLMVSLNVPLYVAYESSEVLVNNKEATWRLQRYKALKELTEENNLQVAVGHHMDDQKTSYVLSFLKNSDRCFIPPLKVILENTVIRPFIILKWDKEKILDYAKKHNLRYVEDPYNVVGDRGTIDLILPDLKEIKQFEKVFEKKYENWWKKNLYNNLVV